MHILKTRRAILKAGAVTVAASMVPAWGDNLPITIIIPAGTGGATDSIGRTLAKVLSELGQPAIVDNKGGAGGALGVGLVARSKPDGRTLLLTPPDAVAVLPHQKPAPYDVMKDLTPMGLVADAQYVAITATDNKLQSFKEVVEQSRRKPGSVTYAGLGVGSSAHLLATLVQKGAGIEFLTAHYAGAGPATLAVLKGETDLTFGSPASFKSQIDAGKVRVLAQTRRSEGDFLKNVPTFKELGYTSFESTAWFGLFYPAQTPADILAKTDALLARAIAHPEMRQRLDALAMNHRPMDRAAFASFFVREYQSWGVIVKASGIDFSKL